MKDDRKLARVAPISVPSEVILKTLRELVAKAEAGEIRSVALAYEYQDGCVGFEVALGKNASTTLLVGEIEIMKTSLVTQRCIEWEDS